MVKLVAWAAPGKLRGVADGIGRSENPATRFLVGGFGKGMSRGFAYTLLVVTAGGFVLLWHAFGPGSHQGDDSWSGIARVRSDHDTLNSMIVTYAINAGRPPTTEQGLEALVTRPAVEPLPEDWVKIADRVPTDSWKQPYHYRELPSKGGGYRWEIRSMGPDRKLWTEDDRYADGRPMRR